MSKRVSKSQFKARALELFREVEQTREEIVVTDRDRPVLKVVPYDEQPDAPLERLRGTVLRYDDPTEPVDVESWEALR